MVETLLLTGATGYVGGRLLQRLLKRSGTRVRCLVRHPSFLEGRVPSSVEVFEGDLFVASSLSDAMSGVTHAFYLVHSMGAAGDFAAADRLAAENFAAAARAAGVKSIVYLGGLGVPGVGLSPHLKSRHEVGDVLRASGVKVIELRASIIIGSGSLSFEMVRALTERLPVLITPRWVRVPAQPIFIGDVLEYLVAALDLRSTESRTFEIGGSDVVSYGDLMHEYARQRGLRRWMIPVPVLTPRLSSLWLGLVTPLYARVGKKLIDSIQHQTIVRDPAARAVFPIVPIGVEEAVARALRNEDEDFAATRWSDAVSSAGDSRRFGGVRFGSRLVDTRSLHTSASTLDAFAAIERIGGPTGWYCADWLWQLRGAIDLILGGVGMRRGRRHPSRLAVGDTLDCWRVESINRGRRLVLAAEMKLPGRAWLEFETRENADGGATVHQTALFDPLGVAGLLYWFGIWPLHRYVFKGMIRGIVRAAESGKLTSGVMRNDR